MSRFPSFPINRSLKAIFRRSFSTNGRPNLPPIRGEKLLKYLPGSVERAEIKHALSTMFSECPEIPCVVNGQEIKTNNVKTQVMPSLHSHVVCKYHLADKALINQAIKASLQAKKTWERMSFEDRSAIFLRAAEILDEQRAKICAAVMMGTGKNVWQAEIDAGAEAIDFMRFAPQLAELAYQNQPQLHTEGVYNRMEHRPLEGFVAAITPFNFCAIAINLPASPAMMGNTVVWKPSSSSLLGNYMMFQALQQAGLPPGVINFVPCATGQDFGEVVLKSPNLAGVNFTGSSSVFEEIWRNIGLNLRHYRNYPRIVGETGGKNFHFAHPSADPENLLHQTVRGAFEYNGQKCSATSRLYVPKSLWETGFKQRLLDEVASVKVGQPDDFDVFVTAVISQRSFDRAKSYIDLARQESSSEVLIGGRCDDSKGYFIHPTVVQVADPKCRLMREEIFAPILSVFVYEDAEFEETLALCADSEYGLTGSIFARDRRAIAVASDVLMHSAGNFYINDKCTGAVVGEQPFGGSRRSGTNDKAGSTLNLLRWVSPRSIKENLRSLKSWKYPHMA